MKIESTELVKYSKMSLKIANIRCVFEKSTKNLYFDVPNT